MDNKNESNKIIEQQTEYGLQMVPLAYVEMVETRHTKEKRTLNICWATAYISSILICLVTFAFMWLQYDCVTTTEYSGAYVMVDSQGNVIESDLSPDDVIRILTELNGNSKNN